MIENYYNYLSWCRDFNERHLIDPTTDKMEWNHTLPQCIFKGHGPGQWLTLRQHAIASALQTLVFQENCMCGWHKTYMPDRLWEMCRPFYSKMCADNAPEFTQKQRLKGIESMRQNQLGFFSPENSTQVSMRQIERSRKGEHQWQTEKHSQILSKRLKGTKWWVNPKGECRRQKEKPEGLWQNGQKWKDNVL